MPKCNACGVNARRVKIIQHGKVLEECCPQCKPQDFERWQDPSNTHGGFRWQYEPQKYKKRDMPDGRILMEATDERNADLEAQLSAPSPYLEAKKQEALAIKRGRRRTSPMTKGEAESAVNRARSMVQAHTRSLLLCP